MLFAVRNRAGMTMICKYSITKQKHLSPSHSRGSEAQIQPISLYTKSSPLFITLHPTSFPRVIKSQLKQAFSSLLHVKDAI